MDKMKKIISLMIPLAISANICGAFALTANAERTAEITYSDGYVTATADGVLIKAHYNGGALTEASAIDVKAGAPEAIEVNEGDVIMLWNNLDDMVPLADKLIIQEQQEEETDAPTNAPEETEAPTDAPEETDAPTEAPTDAPEETDAPTEAPTAAPASSTVYAVYTTDGTASGEVARTEIGLEEGLEAGAQLSVPAEYLSTQKVKASGGLYAVYTYLSGGTEPITVEDGDNLVYITVKQEDGLYYMWEDFRNEAVRDVSSSENNSWYHDGASVKTGFITNTTDSSNTSTALRWYANGTSASREKSFTILSSPDVSDGEVFTFSADIRLGVTNGNGGELRFGNTSGDILKISTGSSMNVKLNDTEVTLPSVTGTAEEAGGSRAISKWLNVNITIDSAKTENNAVITVKPVNSGDKLTINGAAESSYTETVTVSEYAVTKITPKLPKGYFGAIVLDNIKLSKSVNLKAELTKAVELYGGIDTARYESEGVSRYSSALSAANALLMGESIPSESEIKESKTEIISAASELRLKSTTDGERILVNEDPDWIFIKQNGYAYDVADIYNDAPAELDLAGWSAQTLPHTWNAYDGSDGVSGYDKTTGWYRKTMYIDPSYEGKRLYLEFEGACLKTTLYINGQPVPMCYDDPYALGEAVTYTHRGGYNTFRFDITDYVSYGGTNLVAVSVDNTRTIETTPLGGDFSVEGGLYRDVTLVVTSPVHVDMMDHGSNGIYLTPQKVTDVTDSSNTDFDLNASAKIVNNSNEAKTVKIKAELREPDHFDVPDNEYIKEHLRFNAEDMYTPGGRTVGSFEEVTVTIGAGESYDYSKTIRVASPHLWDGMDDPYRYEVELNVYADDELADSVTDNVGFRYYYAPVPTGINSGGGFYLNGRRYDLRGAGKHQDWGRTDDALGVAVTDNERLSDAGVMYELGMNTVRLVHYQHSKREIELYDKLGIVVWSENSLCSVMVNADAAGYPAFEATTLDQLESMIKQQYNDPSVFFWGFSNEITHEFDDSLKMISAQERKFTSAPALFEKMYALAKDIDPIRLTTYAANTLQHKPDLKTDLLGMNTYPYWYNGNTAPHTSIRTYLDIEQDENGNKKPIGFGEYGGAAVVGRTQDYSENGTVAFEGTSTAYTTYQTYMHERVYQDIQKNINAVWATYLWQLFDAANDTTDSVFPGMNIKGLVSYDHTTKKDSYYFYKANWNSFEPFVHIVNAERTQCPSTTTIIRAYSNCDKCRLYIDGKPYGDAITDTNTSDGVSDGFHIFMWYDVPLTIGGQTRIEIRGIDADGNEKATSLDDNGEVVFTAADVTKLALTSNDTTKIKVIENTVNLIGGEMSGVTVADILDGTLVSVPDGSSAAVLDESGNTVTEGALAVGMIIRVSDEVGNYMNYTVAAEATNVAQYKTAAASTVESSKNPASMAVDGIITSDASNSWKAKNSTAGEWITVDLGGDYHLNKLDVYFETKDARAYPFEAQISGDNTDFTTAIDRSSNTDSAYTTDTFADDTIGRYVKLLFGVCRYNNSNRIATVREIEVYGWRFVNTGGYEIDEENKMIYLGDTDSEHDTYEVFSNLRIDGQASYDFNLQEAGRVLSDGDKLIVTEEYGTTKEYTLKLSGK